MKCTAVFSILAVIALTVFSGCAETEDLTKDLPKAYDYFYEGVYDSRCEYEYDAAGNVTKEVYYIVDENGEKVLSEVIESDYDDQGCILELSTYTAAPEEVSERVVYTYENGTLVKAETYTSVNNESILTSYTVYENDSRNRPVKTVQYVCDDGSSEFELYTETVYTYKGDFDTPVSIHTKAISEKAQDASLTTTIELDDQGRETYYESFTDNAGEKIVYEYDGDLLKEASMYYYDNESQDWAWHFTVAYTYNDKGSTIEEYYTYVHILYKTVYEYDESGEKLLTKYEYNKDLEAEEFTIWGKSIFEYEGTAD